MESIVYDSLCEIAHLWLAYIDVVCVTPRDSPQICTACALIFLSLII
jgi:hypothetical protein